MAKLSRICLAALAVPLLVQAQALAPVTGVIWQLYEDAPDTAAQALAVFLEDAAPR